jgi:glycosyltransferase involved in cell wall biosynthesis
MPAYNCEKFIADSIQSVINQSYQNWELLVADDASKDSTKKIIDSYSDIRIKRYHNSENQGYLKTCNKLFKLCVGEYIAFQDADDLSDFNRIQIQLDFLNANPEYALCGTNLTLMDEDGFSSSCSIYSLEHDDILEKIKTGTFDIIPNSFVFKREVYDIIGGYNEFFDRIGVEDYYWTWLILQKYKMKNLPYSGYFYRFNSNSVTGNLSNNPGKINSPKILMHLVKQSIELGNDDLQNGNIDKVKQYLEELNKPYIEDQSYYFHYVAKRRYYEGHKRLAMQNLRKAILKSPFNFRYYKDYIYFLRN